MLRAWVVHRCQAWISQVGADALAAAAAVLVQGARLRGPHVIHAHMMATLLCTACGALRLSVRGALLQAAEIPVLLRAVLLHELPVTVAIVGQDLFALACEYVPADMA